MMYDYWHWTDVVSVEQRKQLIDVFLKDKIGEEKKELQGHNEKGNMKNADVYTISAGRMPELNRFFDTAYKVNQEKFGYNVYPKSNLDVLLLNTYKLGMNYDWHTAAARDLTYDIKLTLIMNLSPTFYEGGKFEIWNNQVYSIDFKPGDMIMFKSGLHHRVTPVANGERISLSHFITGPRFI